LDRPHRCLQQRTPARTSGSSNCRNDDRGGAGQFHAPTGVRISGYPGRPAALTHSSRNSNVLLRHIPSTKISNPHSVPFGPIWASWPALAGPSTGWWGRPSVRSAWGKRCRR
jgi:hypothetical protein